MDRSFYVVFNRKRSLFPAAINAGYIYYSASSGGAAPAPAETGLGNVGMIAAFWKYPLPENWVECNGSRFRENTQS